ncbi:MAG TPA: ferrous iron transport protein B [Pirellulales bacterium]|jgi:ferrous iron transport protein B
MTSTAPTSVCVALVGNPNTGKSTLFNALAGVRQRVGNYPGVTVEKKIGHLTHGGRTFTLIDLPGTYSLAPRSPDEMVAVDVLLGRRDDAPTPEVVLCIVDASNLQRNLYVVSQVLDLGLPTVLALNMVDVARQRGMSVDVGRLSRNLGIPVVELQANRRRGVNQLKDALVAAAGQGSEQRLSPFPEPFRQEVAALCERLDKHAVPGTNAAAGDGKASMPRYLVERLLLDTTGYLEDEMLRHDGPGLRDAIRDARTRLATAGCQVPAIEAVARYGWVNETLQDVVTRPASRAVTFGDRLDRVLTHRVWGSLIFLLMMVVVFQSVFSWAAPAQDFIDAGVARVATVIEGHLEEGALRSLLVDGVIGGVGGVLAFLPQIFILFFFIALLEDCGYMARAAYLMDKLMVRVGLSGKSFIPLLSSFACAIPGVMATRTIENRRDRLTTILIAPLMSCSARLPVYALLIAAFIPERSFLGGLLSLQGLTLTAMYLIGIVAATIVALVLKKTLLRGPTPPFVMELPSYKLPDPTVVAHRVLERGWSFVRRAGTLIVAVAVVVWASLYYPHDPSVEAPFVDSRAQLTAQLDNLPYDDPRRDSVEEQLAQVDHKIAGAYQEQSILGRIGHAIEPAVRPLGWDWRIGCAAIASFPAREVVVATLGIIYNLGDIDVADPDASGLNNALQEATWEGTDRKVFNVPVALSLMVFFALCAQCAATLVIIKRETDSWRWPAFTFGYMTALAYVGALVTYQVGMLLS